MKDLANLVAVVKMEISTAECDIGPKMTVIRGRAVLGYDGQAEAGGVWTDLNFADVKAVKFTPEFACEEWMWEGYSALAERLHSPWIRTMQIAKRAASTRWDGLHHYFLFFDHIGCWEVVATSVTVNDPYSFP